MALEICQPAFVKWCACGELVEYSTKTNVGIFSTSCKRFFKKSPGFLDSLIKI